MVARNHALPMRARNGAEYSLCQVLGTVLISQGGCDAHRIVWCREWSDNIDYWGILSMKGPGLLVSANELEKTLCVHVTVEENIDRILKILRG